MSLTWKLVAANAVVLSVSAVLLMISPTTVSHPVTWTEVITLMVGVSAMVLVNVLIVRDIMRPLRELTTELGQLGWASEPRALPVAGSTEVRQVLTAYNTMTERVHRERAASSVAALAAQEAERKRIARELHDEVGQSLTLALIRLGAARTDPPAAAALDRVEEQINRSLTEVRQLAARLRPGVLDDLGLRSALIALCTDVEAQSPIKVARELDGLNGLDADQELAVYRIAQEALTNVLRHSGAQRAQVTARRDGAAFWLRVADDGAGSQGAEGVGVAGMRERAELAGGRLSISPGEPTGTIVELTIPGADGAAK